MTIAPPVAGRALPQARGPLSAGVLAALADPPHELPAALVRLAAAGGADPLTDEDVQLTLHLAYELHYRALPGVDERWEWHPSLLALRAALEDRLEPALADLATPLLPAGEVTAGRRPHPPRGLAAAAHSPPPPP